MALKRVIPEINVCGVDINSNTIEIGLETQCIDWGTRDLQEGVKAADLVIIATFVSSISTVFSEIAPHLKAGCIITDVGSTKKEVIKKVATLLPNGIHYIPGHPMAGSETHGITGADSYLFENAVYILTPLPETCSKSVQLLEELISFIGARILKLSAYEHDLKVAAVSHLPHVIAASLVNGVGLLEEEQGGVFKLAAGGFRDLTRIADSQPEMWCDILLHNGQSVLETIGLFRSALDDIEKAIYHQKREDILSFFRKAQQERNKVPAKIKGILPEIHEIVVTVPDKPGIIGKFANLLGVENINIIDIEILRVREGDGGTIRLGFKDIISRDKAQRVLRNEGYIVKVRK
ncbi:MAG: hypothetical protein JM58_13630 [Peptococcaceae bacterium BICA1-8]|nr:MAG: hypothetical protein JM58_13630 [Peptococcaceae bacterium BICA1-8]